MKTLERILFLIICAALGLFIGAVAANAQTVNPQAATWDHTDFATATRYDLGYFALPVLPNNTCDLAATPGASPTVTDNLGKPPTTTGFGMTANLVAKPVGCYVAKLRALDASGLFSDWSLASNSFLKRPATPASLAVK
jgi:hypothetical protein